MAALSNGESLQGTEERVADEDLMLRYQDGDTRSFEILYGRHKGPLFRYFLRQCHDRGSCDEMFQEVWLTLVRHRLNYRVEAKFTTYLYRLAHSRLMDHFRRVARDGGRDPATLHDPSQLEELPAESHWQPENVVELLQRETRLLAAIERLPVAQREAFLLRAEAGMRMEEIAGVLQIPLETAKSRLRYAIAKLARSLHEIPYEVAQSASGTR
jgi:RNA polymerase sigma-70 factor, ECF subfamily